MAHTFNPRIQKAQEVVSLELEDSLVYRVNSRTARATQRIPVSKKRKQTKLSGLGIHLSGRGYA